MPGGRRRADRLGHGTKRRDGLELGGDRSPTLRRPGRAIQTPSTVPTPNATTDAMPMMNYRSKTLNRTFDDLRTASLDVGAKAVIARWQADVVNVDVDDRGVLADIDTPADYDAVLRRDER